MVTIKDIANKLGISLGTVSKGLNGASDISEDLRQQILDTAVEMGYTTKKMKKKSIKSYAFLLKIWIIPSLNTLAMILFLDLNRLPTGINGI